VGISAVFFLVYKACFLYVESGNIVGWYWECSGNLGMTRPTAYTNPI